VAIFSSSLFPPLLTFPFSFLYTLPSFPTEVNKKRSYRRQNAVSQKHNTILCFRQSRLAGSIIFSTCPSVRPFVPLPNCESYIWKRMNRFQCRLAQVVPRPGGGIILDLLSRSDRVIQSATEMLPLKREWGVEHSFNCPSYMSGMRLVDALINLQYVPTQWSASNVWLAPGLPPVISCAEPRTEPRTTQLGNYLIKIYSIHIDSFP